MYEGNVVDIAAQPKLTHVYKFVNLVDVDLSLDLPSERADEELLRAFPMPTLARALVPVLAGHAGEVVSAVPAHDGALPVNRVEVLPAPHRQPAEPAVRSGDDLDGGRVV